jgi:putative flippase GtrA
MRLSIVSEKKSGWVTLAKHQLGSIAATVVDFSVMIGCVSWLGMLPALGTACGAFSGGVFNFWLGRKWIFRATTDGVSGQVVRYFFVSFVSMMLNSLGEHLLASVAHVDYVAARVVIAVCVSLLWNYPMQRFVVFRPTSNPGTP